MVENHKEMLISLMENHHLISNYYLKNLYHLKYLVPNNIKKSIKNKKEKLFNKEINL